MNKTKTILTITFAAVAVGLGLTAAVLMSQPPAATNNTQQTQQSAETTQQNPNIVTFRGLPDETVLDQLKNNATVVTKDSAYGVYVDSINGIAGGTDGKYWAFYVDGQMAQVGAAEYKTKGGEMVEWKFE